VVRSASQTSARDSVDQIEAAATALLGGADHLLAIGGDHTIAYPLLRATITGVR